MFLDIGILFEVRSVQKLQHGAAHLGAKVLIFM